MRLTACLIALCLLAAATPAGAVNLPPDFEMLTVGGPSATFTNPVATAFAPDGRIFVSEQRGRIYLLVPDSNAVNPKTDYTKLSTPFLDIEDEVLGHWDRGLLGLALDPDFENNRWVYFAYMVETNVEVGSPFPDYVEDSYTRVERVQASLADPNVADETTRQVLIGATWDTGIPSTHTSHTTGTLVFGDDGTLLISHGDGAHFDGVDPGGRDPESFVAGRADPDEDVGAFRAPYLDSMAGKILRIDPNTGEGLPSNPWFEPGNPGSDRSRVWAKGLRNPYRMDLKRGSGSTNPADGNPGLIAVSDVGWQDWEEMNLSRGGEDFGWPCYEGLLPEPDYQSQTPTHSGCTGDDSYVTYGAMTWPHGSGGSAPFAGLRGLAAVGSTFVSGLSWPSAYRDRLYFTDYTGRWIYAVKLDENEQPVEMIEFATDTPTPVELRFDPYSRDLFSINFDDGTIVRYVYTGPTGAGEDPSPPTGVVASPGNGIVELSWDLNPEIDVVGYQVYRSFSDTGPWTQVTTQLVAETNWTDTGVLNDTEYWYYVVAVDGEEPARTSGPSATVSAIPIAKAWEWYVPHPGPTADFLAAPAPFPRRITLPDPNASPNYDLWTSNNRAPQLRREVHPTDDFTLEAGISLVDFISGELFHTGIIVRFSDFDALIFGPHRGTSLRLERTGSANIASTDPGLTAMDLRVVRTGTTYSFEYRADASQPWSVVHTYDTGTTPTHAGVFAKSWDPDVGLVVDVARLGLNELPPVAIAGADALTGPAPHTVQFSSTSFDPDGPFLAHAWDFGDGTTSGEAAPSHEFTAPGPYEVILTVTDGGGFTAADTLAVFAEGNQPPTAQITAPADGFEFINDGVSPLALEGLGTDPDDLPDSLSYTWSIDLHDGGSTTAGYLTPAAGALSSFIPDVVDAGQGVTWDIVLTVTDPGGLSAADTVTVVDATLPPVALLDLRAALADGAAPPAVPGAASPWVNLGSAGAAADGALLNFGGVTGWAGDGSPGEPWRLDFDGVDDVVVVGAGTLPGLDQAASVEMWVRFPQDVASRAYLLEWLETTAAPFPGMSLAVENGQLRIFLGSWIDLAPVEPSRWSRILVTKGPGQWLVELDGAVVGQGSTGNLGAQVTELVLGAGTFAGAGIYSEHAAVSIAEVRVWDRALSDVNRTVLASLDHTAWTNAPRLELVAPAMVDNDGPHPLTLTGIDFVDGATVQLMQADVDTVDAESVTFVGTTEVTASFDFLDFTAGPRDVVVTNPDGQQSVLPAAVTVNAPSPAILEFLASMPDAANPPAVPSIDEPWLSTLGPDTLRFEGLEISQSGWRGDGSVSSPWHLQLDGDDDLLTLAGPGLDSLDATTEITAEFWVQVDVADSSGTLFEWSEYFESFQLSLTRDGLALFHHDLIYDLAPLVRDRWTHVVLTLDGTATRLYLDGVEAGSAPGITLGETPPTLTIGESLNARLSVLRLATVAMTANQIISGYGSDKAAYPPRESARISLSGSTDFLADGDSLSVDLMYDDLGNDFGLRGTSVSVNYDPTLLAFVEATEGDFLPSAGSTFFTVDTATPGTISFDTTLLGQGAGAMGAGAIAQLRFAHVVVPADTTTTLTITLDELVDAGDPPTPIPALSLKPMPLFLHGGTIVASPQALPRTRLHGAAPNPFNPRTTIAFDLERPGRARLVVYDLAGRQVRVLADETLGAGRHEFIWDGVDQQGRRVASGVYLYALRPDGGDTLVRKMTLVK